ncbi:MAG: hypothetical protein V1649_03775 [Patescibacteria group bacterium]
MPEKFEHQKQDDQVEVEKFDLKKPLIVSDMNYERYDPEGEYKLFEFEDDPNHIVRVEDLDMMRSYLSDENLTIQEAAEKTKAIFDELRNKFGIDAPVNFATAVDETGTQLLYIITDRVQGQKVEEIDFDPLENGKLAEEFENFYLSLVKYFVDKFNSNELVLWDIAKSSALKYGKKPGDNEDNIYLVDTDVKSEPGEYGIGDLYDIFPTVRELESKCGRRFDKVRKELKGFIDSFSKSNMKTGALKYIDENIGRLVSFLEK